MARDMIDRIEHLRSAVDTADDKTRALVLSRLTELVSDLQCTVTTTKAPKRARRVEGCPIEDQFDNMPI